MGPDHHIGLGYMIQGSGLMVSSSCFWGVEVYPAVTREGYTLHVAARHVHHIQLVAEGRGLKL